MNIAINCRILNERRGGPYRFTYNLIKELAAIDRKNRYFLVFNKKKYEFDFPLPGNFIPVCSGFSNKLLFDYISLPVFSFRNEIDVFIFPKNTFSTMIRSGARIPIYHDIVYYEKDLDFKEFKFFDQLHHTVMIRIDAKIAEVNLSVSDFTARRMRELLGIPELKIRVIKEGVERRFRRITAKKTLDAVRRKYDIRPPFFFYAGSLSPRKNIVRVLKAFMAVKDTIPHNLCLTSAYSWNDREVLGLLDDPSLEGRVSRLGFLSEEELVAVYSMADAYLYPSLYEGFGLPILEAQACGCPVITGTAASCPEVAGDGALLVDPYSVEDIARAMKEIVTNRRLRARLIKAGHKNAAKYSWEKMAREYCAMFGEIAANQNR